MAAIEAPLIGHWPLSHDLIDHGPYELPTHATDVQAGQPGPHGRFLAASFNGRSSQLAVADHPRLQLGRGDFTVSLWVRADDSAADVVGSLVGKFDSARRRGLNLSILTASGVVSTGTANYRQLQFGIDDDTRDAGWRDEGRPGQAAKIAAMTTFDGALYVGTLELGAEQVGHLWRYEGGQRWYDLGNPMGCNSVSSITEHDGELFVGLARYKPMGSALGDTLNMKPGGRVFRLTADAQWIDCGQPGGEDAVPEDTPVDGYSTGKADSIYGLTSFQGRLYCTSTYRRGVYRYEGGTEWKPVGLADQRMFTFAIYRRQLFSLINGGPVYRYEGDSRWVDCGTPKGSNQNYAALIHHGAMHIGTWPRGEVFRYDGPGHWHNQGRAGYEMEIMGGLHYNGSAYWGSLPMANVFRMEESGYTFIGQLDDAPVVLRRVWCMASHEGRLFAGTLPSGRVWSIEAGRVVTWDRSFPRGWHHIAAVRAGRHLLLYVDGQQIGRSSTIPANTFCLDNAQPLIIGNGAYEHFDGMMSDVRIYAAALDHRAISRLAENGAG